MKHIENKLKRFLDIIISSVILLVTSPFLLFILVPVYFLLRQPPIIRQERGLDLNREKVIIYKIRTIRSSKKFNLLENNSKSIFNKREYKEFIPGFCKWLRKSGVDEIPQLVNVIKGDMSLVGPRPFINSDLILLKTYTPSLYHLRTKLKSKPGITGYWQIWGDRSLGAANLIELDEYYDLNKSLSLDFKIMFETFRTMLFARHSDSILTNKKKHFIQNVPSCENVI